MHEFLKAVGENPFIANALVTALLASVASGIIGSYVVVRRITYIAGGIAHCVLGGIGAARYLQAVHGWDAFRPIYGATAAALIAAIVIGVVSLRARQREDTVIGSLWAVGMASGVLFIWGTPGYAADLTTYLFGNILMVSRADLFLVAALDVGIVLLAMIFYNQFLAVCFDEQFARLRGVNVQFYYLVLLCLTALTVVLLTSVVGIVMVIALLTLPAAIAGNFSRRLWQMMLLAVAICMLLTTTGLGLSYGPGLPPGATIVVLAGAAYLLVVAVKTLARRRRKRPNGSKS